MHSHHFDEMGFREHEKIGEGAFGQVFKGIYRGEEAAVKIIQNSPLSETSILQYINHPNVIKLWKEYKFGSQIYLVMEYCSGGSLRDYTSLTEDQIIQVMKCLFSALEYLHSQGIIHRDIKPDNILIKNQSDFRTIKLADFGLSFQYDTEIKYYQTVSQQCGTFIFMAPEQIQNLAYNKTVDTWSCGIVLYMLLMGRHPYYPRLSTKQQFIESYPNIQYDEPLNASSLSRDLLKRLLCYDPHRRYTASQALSHPWITRRFNDSIPMGLKEFGTCKQLSENLISILKAVMFVQYFIKTNSLRSQSRQDSETSILKQDHHRKSTLLKPLVIKNTSKLQQDDLQKKIRLSQLTALLVKQQSQTNHHTCPKIASQPTLDSPKKNYLEHEMISSISPMKGDSEHSKLESPHKSFRKSQSFQRLILPQLSDSTQTSISPVVKRESKTIVMKKSQSILELQRIQGDNEQFEQKTTLRQRMETYDQKHHSHRLIEKTNSLNTSTISPKNRLVQQIIMQQQQLLILPKYRKRL